MIFCSIEKHLRSPLNRFVFAATSNCEVIHGTIYSCLRAMFGLSVVGILVSIFSCMLVYQVVKMMVLTLTLMVVMKMSNMNTTIFDIVPPDVGKRISLMTLMMLMLVMLMYNVNTTILNLVH